VRIVCISDTHERHAQITLPDGDLLICAGDVTANGNLVSLERFARWMQASHQRQRIDLR
jgi:predicted phosphodiesterase